ncbi:MAG: hypothetical protein K2X86_17275 [Cytophagaceae bacterium]|nr:hypothetical protein [Cytophagaceae bacterium]
MQEETVLTRGAINQWNFSYGANFNDKIYIGASLGLPQLRYIAEKSYKETVINNDTLDNFRFNESLKVRGGGVNFKVGLIAKPEDWLRVGVTLQSPTFYSINEEYVYQIKAIYKNVVTSTYVLDQEEERTNPGVYRYNLTTPFRASAGLAIFAGKAGFVSADIEYVPYNRAKLKESQSYLTFNNSTFEGDNNTIKNIYRSTYNINVGGEFRLAKIYRLRAGYSLMNDPYNDIDNVDRKTTSISGGAGVRLDKYYLDIALVNTKFNSLYRPYALSNGIDPKVSIKNKNTSFILTTGVFF